jgi:hypothetical protein
MLPLKELGDSFNVKDVHAITNLAIMCGLRLPAAVNSGLEERERALPRGFAFTHWPAVVVIVPKLQLVCALLV